MRFDVKWFEACLKDTHQNQAEFARGIGSDQSKVSKVKHGKRRWQPRELPLVAKCLKVSVEELLRHSDLDAASVGAGTTPATDEPPPASLTLSDSSLMNGALLGEILAIIERVYKAEGMPISPEHLGEMAAFEYDSIVAGLAERLASDPDRRTRKLSRIEPRLRNWIRSIRAHIMKGASFKLKAKNLGP